MKILVLNCGSSTLKFQVIEAENKSHARRRLARGIVDRIGELSSYRFEGNSGFVGEDSLPVDDHEAAVTLVIEWLRSDPELKSIDAIGHRVVHGGDRFISPVRVDDLLITQIEQLSEIAPLHNPAAVKGIRATRKILGTSLPMVAVFDTAFHHTIPDYATTYAIPYELTIKYGIRRYGFHGLAHQYSLLRYTELTGQRVETSQIITLHLGNGCSACAIRGGQSADTSMGFTPLEGLVMGTRSGDIDPALLDYLARKEKVTTTEVEQWLNHRSGLLGLSGLSNDMREIMESQRENARSRLALEVFCYRARKYLGAYLAALGGAQAVIFSGGIGENAPLVREKICLDMEWCGLRLDRSLNARVVGGDGEITGADSSLRAYVIHTDEEALIARETAALVLGREGSSNGNQF